MRQILLIIIIALLCGCGKPQAEKSELTVVVEPLGKILSAEVIPTSFNESMKMSIKTEKATITIWALLPRVDIGKEAISKNYSNGKRSFTWESHPCEYGY